MSQTLIQKLITNSKKKKDTINPLHLSTTSPLRCIPSPKNSPLQPFARKFKYKKSTSLSPVKLTANTRYTKPKIKEKTLVIDLDETLVHSSFDYFDSPDLIVKVDLEDTGTTCDIYVSIRPGAKSFINELSNYYEIIIFTASSSKYAEPLMNVLDEHKNVSQKLFRENCTVKEGLYIKDLTQLGRDLRNIVLIDNNIVSFAFQQDNGIPIKSWFDDYNDIELLKLVPILKNLSGFYDVRTEIPKFVSSNTFIWMKGINWLKENMLNVTYLNEVENVLKIEKRNFELGNEANLSELNEETKQKEKNTSNDFIKITNNYFYDNSNNIKIVEDETDEEFEYERMLTEIDHSKKEEHESKVLKKSSSLKKKKFDKQYINYKCRNNEGKKVNINNNSTLDDIFKKFPKLNKKIDFSTKEKNKTLKENIYFGNKINNTSDSKNKNNNGQLEKKVIHHFPSYSINYVGMAQKKSKTKKNLHS